MNNASVRFGSVPHRKGAGFTLLEMVVSLAIIALVALVLSQVFVATLRTNTKTELLKDVKQNGELAIESMVRMLQHAQSVTSTCSETGTSASSVTFVNPDGGTTTLGCVLDGTVTRLASTSAEGAVYLTSDDVTMGGASCLGATLRFTCFGGTGVPSSVTISFQLAQSGTPGQAFESSSESFQTTATMRNIPE